MGKSIALAQALLVSACVVLGVVAVDVQVKSLAEAQATLSAEAYAALEARHYGRLWHAASSEHVAVAANGAQQWRCCRPCAKNTVPVLHEAFEGDKDDVPAMKGAPPEGGAPKALFLETQSDASAASHGRGGGWRSRKETEFQIAQRKKAIAQADALAGRRVDSTAYSCCNMCPDLMYPFPGTWNRPSPYSYRPPSRFRFAKKPTAQRSLVETASMMRAATGAGATAEAEAESESGAEADAEAGSDRYVPTNPHHLPKYLYWESTQKAAPARSRAARDGKFDKPVRPGAEPLWHPPPPPHDDLYRMSRSPNLHDGNDLETPPFLPPCCDFCMSTYFPHIINDEWQLPQKVPYTIGPFSKAFVQLDERMADAATSATSATSATTAARSNNEGISSAEAAAKLLPSAKSNPNKCCHKCVRKDIEDTDWRVYALPPKPKKSPNHRHHGRRW